MTHLKLSGETCIWPNQLGLVIVNVDGALIPRPVLLCSSFWKSPFEAIDQLPANFPHQWVVYKNAFITWSSKFRYKIMLETNQREVGVLIYCVLVTLYNYLFIKEHDNDLLLYVFECWKCDIYDVFKHWNCLLDDPCHMVIISGSGCFWQQLSIWIWRCFTWHLWLAANSSM